jgi:hypothetical protein
VTNNGAVPPDEEIISQLPPSEVLVLAVQLNVPDPPFRICMVWLAGGFELLVTSEKLSYPGKLSTMVAPALTIVNVTGIASTTPPTCEVTTTCPL